MSVLEKLTEGIVDRDLSKDGAAILNKWEQTGLLEGLGNDRDKNYMSRLLENQAKELLREASSMAGGDVEGFAAVAFPIVRRVFGGLIANDLVSVQPMSLPSGLIFFMDFTVANTRAGDDAGESVYGGGKVAKGIQTGVTDITENGGGFYNLQSGYSSPTGSLAATLAAATTTLSASKAVSAFEPSDDKLVRYDPDLLGSAAATKVQEMTIDITSIASSLNRDNLIACTLQETIAGQMSGSSVVRRLTSISADGNTLTVVLSGGTGTVVTATAGTLKFPLRDNMTDGGGLGSVVGADPWGLEGADDEANGIFDGLSRDVIPEIDIKVDSVAVTAMTKKLKAKWSPELGQDLNAYHNLDAEVELTSILSEQIALEIDQEILNDLVKGATAGTYYWSRRPGKFVDRASGATLADPAADFTGTVSEWYETLLETVNDVSAQIHRKVLRGGATFLVCSPEVANILEFTAGFRAKVTHDDDKGTAGAVNVGTLSGKWDIMVDPYFPRNVILVGRKGSNFLESGYVYSPYVPLQVTPTIFGPEDFVPRKGVMTRYAKKMVRPDMYGLVICQDLLG
jgi:hypothetical protein